jgi:uncharacterized phage protein (TIGR02218 family)
VKVIPIALASHYAQEVTTICLCLKVQRSDGIVLGCSNHDQAFTIEGVEYAPGCDMSGLASTDTLAVDNMEITVLPDETITHIDLLAGRWRGARWTVFQVNYKALDDSPGPAIDILKSGTVGEATLNESFFTVELRGKTQPIQQTQGDVTSKTCRARLGDDRCTKDLTAFTFSSTFTAVASGASLTDSARAEAADFFGEGEILILDGDAEGLRQKVKSFEAGVFTLSLPLPITPAPGDGYTVIAGCRRRLEEDCRDKFDNVLNFQGEPHLPGQDKLSREKGGDE